MPVRAFRRADLETFRRLVERRQHREKIRLRSEGVVGAGACRCQSRAFAAFTTAATVVRWSSGWSPG